MMLDDFFTLTEINNGLTVPSRVKELVAVMQEQRDSAVMNASEVSRQWSAVGSAVAATENQECLDLFVNLDGLQFISNWLKDAQKFSNNSSDSFLEESIVHLLQALKKLQVDYEKLVAADIWTTVNELLVHVSSKVKDEAQVLIETWKKKRDGDELPSDVETFGAMTDDVGKSACIKSDSGHLESSQKDDSLSKETFYKEKDQESTRDDPMLSACSDIVHPDHGIDEAFECLVKDNNPPSNHASSPSLLKAAMELSSSHSLDAFSVEKCNPVASKEDTLDGQMECNELESESDKKYTPKIVESLPDKSKSIEEINSLEPFPASSDVAEATNSVTEPGPQELHEPGNKCLSDEGSLYVGSRKTDSDGKCPMDQCRNSSGSTEEGGEYHTLCKTSGPDKSWGNTTDLGASRSVTEDDHGKIRKHDLHVSGDNLVNDYKFAKKEMHREPDRSYRKSDVELYGIIDPLEFARQVAREVEREVVDYREQSCSSSDKLPVDNVQQPGSPDSVSGKQSSSSEGLPNEVENSPDLSGEASPAEEESATSSDNLDAEHGTQDIETSQVTEAAQEEVNTEKAPCNFDLNLEVFSEDADRSAEQLLTPVSVVSASRAAAPPGLPVAPLQFMGNLGWKGSAATSAFRRASPRRLPENEKDISSEGNSSNSKQLQRFLDIDLNVAEGVDGGTGELSPNNNFPLFPNLLSGESSVVTNPIMSERFNLDLNLTSEDGARPSDWQMGQFFPHANGHHNWSHSSPSSSKQPSFKNFDLNDRPLFMNDQSDNSYLLSQSSNVTGGVKSDDSAISLMGTRVEVSRKNLASPALPNGRTSELAFDVNLGRSGSFMGTGTVLPFAHSSPYSCNNIVPGPAMPFSSAIYGSVGPIPYIMDSRAPPVLPHIVGSPSALPAGFMQTPFFLNMTNSTTPPNGAGAGAGAGAGVPSWGSFDLNSGTIAEDGSRTGRSMDEQMRSNTQLSMSSVVNGKRKEPDNGLEHYPLRHYTPPWK